MAAAVKDTTKAPAKKKAKPKPPAVTHEIQSVIKFKVQQQQTYGGNYTYKGTAIRSGEDVKFTVECQEFVIPLKTLQALRDILNTEVKIDSSIQPTAGVKLQVVAEVTFDYKGKNGGKNTATFEKNATNVVIALSSHRDYKGKLPKKDFAKIVEFAEKDAKIIVQEKKTPAAKK